MDWYKAVFEFNFFKYGFYIAMLYTYRFRSAWRNPLIVSTTDFALAVVIVAMAACLWPVWVVWDGVRLGWRVGKR